MNRTFSSGVYAKYRTDGRLVGERGLNTSNPAWQGWACAEAAAAIALLADDPILKLFAEDQSGINKRQSAGNRSTH